MVTGSADQNVFISRNKISVSQSKLVSAETNQISVLASNLVTTITHDFVDTDRYS